VDEIRTNEHLGFGWTVLSSVGHAYMQPLVLKLNLCSFFEKFPTTCKLFFKLVIIIVRESSSHKWTLLGVFELLLGTLLTVYENSITVSVVVP